MSVGEVGRWGRGCGYGSVRGVWGLACMCMYMCMCMCMCKCRRWEGVGERGVWGLAWVVAVTWKEVDVCAVPLG